LWQEKAGIKYQPSTGEGLYRRSLYTFWKRTSPPPSMMIFDAAKRDVCVVRRQETNTPLQALVLWNDPQLIEASRVLAGDRLGKQRPIETVIASLYHELSARADETPVQLLLDLYQSELAHFHANAEATAALLAVGEAPNPEGVDEAQHAALTIVCSTLLSSELVVTLR
jgi:hypothetical protein